MKKLKLLIWFFPVFCFAPAVQAENTFTLQDCFKAALKRSEVLADQQEQIIQAEEHYHQAFGSILPQVGIAGSYFVQESGTASSPMNQTLVRLSADQPLFRGFREFAALHQTQALIAFQQESRQWAGLQLYSDLAQSFYAVLALEQDLVHVDTQTKLYEERIRDLNARARIGRSRHTEVLTVQTAQAILKAQRQQLLGQIAVAREVLVFLTGLDPHAALNNTESLPAAMDSAETYLALVEKRPDVLAARKKMEASKENIALAQGARLPSADLSGNYYPVRPSPSQNINWDAQITVTMPLFEGGYLVSKVAEADSQVRQSEIALEQVLRLDREDISNAYHNLQADLAQVAAFEEAAVLSHKNYLANLQDYNYGLVTNLDVLQALTSDQDTQRSLDKARFAARTDYQNLLAKAARVSPERDAEQLSR